MVTSDLRERLQSTLGPAYQIEREIGSGGMAHVYVAQDTLLRRTVVIKVLSPELAGSVDADRFRRETQILAQLHHPRIVPVLGAGQSGTLLYYTMPFIAGESLRATLHRDRQLPLETALRYATDVADALTYAHQHNVVHRDIKPDNVMIDEGRALVTDFGISRAIERASDIDSVTSTGLTVGTPKYMSPEQASADRHIDGRSDIYSLACVLYEMLVGEPPFPGTNSRLVLARHLQTAAPSARVGRPDLPEHVDRALLKALAKAPADRFATPQEFVEALKAGPMGILDRSRTAVAPRRLHARFAIAGVSLLALAAGAAVIIRAGDGATRPSALDPSRIAVTYFDAPASDTQLVAVARGMTREMIFALERLPGLRLVSEWGIRPLGPRPSVDSIARVFDVGTVIVGDVERMRDSIRVSIRLVDARTHEVGRTIRARYPARMLIELRDSVVDAVVTQLRPQIGRAVRVQSWRYATRSSRAWALRQQAQELTDHERAMTRERTDSLQPLAVLARAESLLVRASREDPSWLEPAVARAWIGSRRVRLLPPARASVEIDAAIAIVDSVLAREPERSEVLGLRGRLRYQRWSNVPRSPPALLDAAGRDLRSATASDPNNARAWNSLSDVLRMQGDTAGAVDAVIHAMQADSYLDEVPESTTKLIFAYLFAGKSDSARTLCQTAIERMPGDAWLRSCELSVLGWAGRGSVDVARAWVLVADVEKTQTWGLTGRISPHARYFAAAVLARSGMADSARAVVRATRARMRSSGAPDDVLLPEAFVLTLTGDRDSAVTTGERAVAADSTARDRARRLPWFDPLRTDPRFARLVAR